MAILSFNSRVDIAIGIVTEKYPEAWLYEAGGIASGGPTKDPNGGPGKEPRVDNLRVVFGNVDNTTVIIKEIKFGKFGEPQVIHEPWVGDVVVDWPIKMDLQRANELKENAGYDKPYSAVVLRQPLYPGDNNPYFIFGARDEAFIFVDTVTGAVQART